MNTKAIQLLAAAFVFLFLAATPASAQLNLGVNEFGAQTSLGGGGEGGLIGIISNIINIALGFLGILVVLYLLYGGFQWMTSGGEMDKVKNAKKTIVNAIIGLLIILSSWAITVFVLGALGGATGGDGGGGSGGDGLSQPSFDDSLGGGILNSHYPGRNAVGIPRNAPIIITFKEPMKVDTIIQGTSDLKVSSVVIKPRGGSALAATDVIVTHTPDNQSFTIRAKNPLGSATQDTDYTVELNSNVAKASGQPAFGIRPYTWNFSVSTVLDQTPPKVLSIFPRENQTQVPRNAVITVTFDEPVDPNSGLATGAFDVKNVATNLSVVGTTKYSNGYRTIEFVPSQACGTSTCGSTIYCLPGGSGTANNIEITLNPAHIDPTLGAPASAMSSSGLYDGLADVIGNSFDGNKNGTAEGPGTAPTLKDTFKYQFATNNTVRTSAPIITGMTPAPGTESVAFDAAPTITFQPYMQYSTLGSENISLKSPKPVPYYTEAATGVVATDTMDGTTVVTIKHDLFAENADYQPEIGSAVRDIYQNCFNPISCTGAGCGVAGTCTTTSTNPYCCYDPATRTVKPQATSCAAPTP